VNPYAVKYELPRAWGYSLLSFGSWPFYWLYVTRRLLDGETGRGRDDALLHTLGMLVPVLNAFVLYWLYRDLDEVRRRAGLTGLSVGGYVVGGILAAPILYSIALGKVNEYWDVRTQGLAVEAPITGAEKAIVAVGAAIWVLWTLLLVLGLVLLIVLGDSSS
jgi:hypothetical protein